ncbi:MULTISPECIES: M15 family metallopeptidase [unclassified Polaribacter]|uniref:M15 family metallopeptidase n=1 Tax=unclassified Polaribacter TaxID=196858 RepID=UPI0011BE6C53|nr:MULTISPECIES: M15 family metallopeptidase [unclassified Polaribacter]TXD51076.1 M15 family metallopeptidase [Polaribacter sp. IC063]TXD57957.1 M15 family metallopeptidase [Polaribacter sp. IC066]
MKKVAFLCAFLFSHCFFSQEMPNGFVYVSDIDSTITSELRYLGSRNFIGKPIDGYKNNCVIMSKQAAKNLKQAQTMLLKKGFSLKIFDAYRPQKAVDHFVRWATVLNDTLMKKEYYPSVAKSALFKRGYIASKSGHTRGSTLDVTLINLKTGKEVDMGSPYDFFGVQSHPFYSKITDQQKENRMLLRTIMQQHNFKPYKNEWWHFTLKEEPYPKTYFNFNVN